MANEPPKSRPEPADPGGRTGNPQPGASVYGGQWGRSGKQKPDEQDKPDRPKPIRPTRKRH